MYGKCLFGASNATAGASNATQGESTPFEILLLEGQSELVVGNHNPCQGQSSAEPPWVAVMFAIAGSEYSCCMHLCTEVPVVRDCNWLQV